MTAILDPFGGRRAIIIGPRIESLYEEGQPGEAHEIPVRVGSRYRATANVDVVLDGLALAARVPVVVTFTASPVAVEFGARGFVNLVKLKAEGGARA